MLMQLSLGFPLGLLKENCDLISYPTSAWFEGRTPEPNYSLVLVRPARSQNE